MMTIKVYDEDGREINSLEVNTVSDGKTVNIETSQRLGLWNQLQREEKQLAILSDKLNTLTTDLSRIQSNVAQATSDCQTQRHKVDEIKSELKRGPHGAAEAPARETRA